MAILIEVPGGHAKGLRPHSVRADHAEVARPGTQEHVDGVASLVRHREVELAVSGEVGHCQGRKLGPDPGASWGCRRLGPCRSSDRWRWIHRTCCCWSLEPLELPLDATPVELPADDPLLPVELPLVPPLTVEVVDRAPLEEEDAPLEPPVVGDSGVPAALHRPPSPQGKMSSGPTLRQPSIGNIGKAMRRAESRFTSSHPSTPR